MVTYSLYEQLTRPQQISRSWRCRDEIVDLVASLRVFVAFVTSVPRKGHIPRRLRHRPGHPGHGHALRGRGRDGRVPSPSLSALQPIATMRSIGSFAFAAISGATLTSNFISTSESRSFGRVIIFMYLQKAIRLASIRFACGAACWSG